LLFAFGGRGVRPRFFAVVLSDKGGLVVSSQGALFQSLGAAAVQAVSGENIMDRAVLLSLTIHRFGISKKVKSTEVQSDASPEMIRVSKKIFASKEYDAICKHDGKFTRLLSDLALPSLFRSGVYAVPLGLIDRVDREMIAYLDARVLLVDEFVRWYTREIWTKIETGEACESERLLGSLFEQNNYLSPETVRARFGVDYRFVSTSLPEKLRQIRADIWARESARAHAEIDSFTESVKGVLRESMRDLLAHAVEKLKPTAEGKQQIFRDSLVGNVRQFLETFQARNIADDVELAAICQQVDGLLSGVTPDALRADGSLRDEVRSQFQGITTQLDSMIIERPGRKLRRVLEEKETEVTSAE
jgi:hypothetical protein